jgi:hypothetical protein
MDLKRALVALRLRAISAEAGGHWELADTLWKRVGELEALLAQQG